MVEQSFTGVEIIRVLKANRIGPILLIAFTNHALDHMLSSILDANITKRIVRLGRRANDERIAQYSMETLEMVQHQSRLDRTFSSQRRELKEIEEEIQDLMKNVMKLDIDNDTDEIMKYLSTIYPEYFEYLSNPPLWVSNVKGFMLDDEGSAGEWQTAGRGGKTHVLDQSTYAFWRNCSDLAFIDQITNRLVEPWKSESPAETELHVPQNAFSALEVEVARDSESSDEEELSDTGSIFEEVEVEESWKTVQLDQVTSIDLVIPQAPAPSTIEPSSDSKSPIENAKHENTIGFADIKDIDGFFDALGFQYTPSVPHSDRPLEELLENVGDVWEMSETERHRIHGFWVEQARVQLGQTYMGEFERLRKFHARKLRQCNEGKEEVSCFIYLLFLNLKFYQVRRSLLHDMDIIGCTTTGLSFLLL